MTAIPQKPRPNASKIIKINIDQQIVEAFEGSTKVFRFECVTGDRDHPADRGLFRIIRKPYFRYRSHAYNVQMNYPLFFTHDGKALHQYHGPMPLWAVRSARSVSDWVGSHGCVRLVEDDAKGIYEWASIGTAVHVL